MLLHLLDPREKTAIEPLPPALALAGGVFELPSEGGAKLDGRGEVGAGFADGFKGAVEFNRSVAQWLLVAGCAIPRIPTPGPVDHRPLRGPPAPPVGVGRGRRLGASSRSAHRPRWWPEAVGGRQRLPRRPSESEGVGEEPRPHHEPSKVVAGGLLRMAHRRTVGPGLPDTRHYPMTTGPDPASSCGTRRRQT